MTIQPAPPGIRPALHGATSGIFFLAIFGIVWGMTGVSALGGPGALLLGIVVVAAGLFLFSRAILLRRAAERLPPGDAGDTDGFTSGWFSLIVVLEFLIIGLAVAICVRTNHPNLLPPLIALIVGVHFFPLAALFHVRVYYVTGALLCLLAALTIVAVPSTATMGAHQIQAARAVVGFGAAIVIFAAGAAVWLRGRALLQAANTP